MRDLFRGYYLPTADEADSIWRDGLIVLDANILLALYNVRPASANLLLDALRSRQSQLWIPYQVALDFHRNVHTLRAMQANAHKRRIDKVNNLLTEIRSTAANSRFRQTELQRHAVEQLEAWAEELKAERNHISAQTDPANPDELLDHIAELFDGHVGVKPSEEELEALHDAGAERYKNRRPPGYEDDHKKSPEKFSDYVLWRHLMDHAAVVKRDVIFVTNDNKSDWWLKVQGLENTSMVPRPELIQEFREEVGQDILLLNSEQFYRRITSTTEMSQRNAEAVAARQDMREAVIETQAEDYLRVFSS